VNAVKYKVKDSGGKGRVGVVHIINIKKYVERDKTVFRLTVVAEDMDLKGENEVNLKNECQGFVQADIDGILIKLAS